MSGVHQGSLMSKEGMLHASLLIGFDSAWNMARYYIRSTYEDVGKRPKPTDLDRSQQLVRLEVRKLLCKHVTSVSRKVEKTLR